MFRNLKKSTIVLVLVLMSAGLFLIGCTEPVDEPPADDFPVESQAPLDF